MIESNRLTVQLSFLAAFATLAFGAVSNAQVTPVTLQPATTSSTSSVTAEEKVLNDRLLLRYTQLWNMYRFRNEVSMSNDEKQKVDDLIAAVQAPILHSEMPTKDLRAAITANAVELTKRLKIEAAGDVTPDHAVANLAYLQGTLLKAFTNTKTYAMSGKKFRDEFPAALPADPSLPDSITHRSTPGDVKPSGTVN